MIPTFTAETMPSKACLNGGSITDLTTLLPGFLELNVSGIGILNGKAVKIVLYRTFDPRFLKPERAVAVCHCGQTEESPNITGQGAGRELRFKTGSSGASRLLQRVQQKAYRPGLPG